MKATSINRSSALIVLAIALASNAHAAPPAAADFAAARELYKKGMTALDAGDNTLARDQLASAWAMAPTPIIGAALARAQERIGQLVEARETVLAVRRLHVSSNETARSSQARQDTDAMDPVLVERIPRLHVMVSKAPEGAFVLIDGARVPLSALSVDRQVDPGPHTLEISINGRSFARTQVEIAERERIEVTLQSPPEAIAPIDQAQPTQPTPPTQPQPIQITPEQPRHASPLPLVGGITLGVGAAVGIVFGALAMNKASAVSAICASDHICPTGSASDIDALQTYGIVSTTGFIVAGVGAVLLVTGLVMNTRANRARVGWQTIQLQFE